MQNSVAMFRAIINNIPQPSDTVEVNGAKAGCYAAVVVEHELRDRI